MAKLNNPTTKNFVEYFQKNKPSDTGLKFLKAHYASPGHAATMGELATALGYSNHNASNLHYGKYAGKVAQFFVETGVLSGNFFLEYYNIVVFVKDFVPSKDKDLVLYMRDELSSALEELGYVKKGMKSLVKMEKTDPSDPASFEEGDEKYKMVKQYERSTEARRECVSIHGDSCAVCEISFGKKYGPNFAELIVVHHLKPMSVKEKRKTNPAEDLRPLCPNCHAMAHYRLPGSSPRSIEELKKIIKK